MIRLIHSNLARLFHSSIFKAAEVFSIGYSFFVLIGSYISYKNHYGAEYNEQLKHGHFLDNMPLALAIVLPIVLAIVIGFFIGAEYSDGTMRNKLIAGHSRISIYFANMLAAYAASVILFLTSVIVIYAVGIPLYGPTSIPFTEYAKAFLVVLIAGFAFCSLYTLFCMAIQNKAAGVVTVLLIAIIMYMVMMTINARLLEPEYYDNYTYTQDAQNPIHIDKQKNPHYLTGKKRVFYEKLVAFLPYDHMFYLLQNITLPKKPYEFPVNSGILIFVTTAAGILIFKKKDLK